jgi:hypothetical protein
MHTFYRHIYWMLSHDRWNTYSRVHRELLVLMYFFFIIVFIGSYSIWTMIARSSFIFEVFTIHRDFLFLFLLQYNSFHSWHRFMGTKQVTDIVIILVH